MLFTTHIENPTIQNPMKNNGHEYFFKGLHKFAWTIIIDKGEIKQRTVRNLLITQQQTLIRTGLVKLYSPCVNCSSLIIVHVCHHDVFEGSRVCN